MDAPEYAASYSAGVKFVPHAPGLVVITDFGRSRRWRIDPRLNGAG
jgi:hypothetical protein